MDAKLNLFRREVHFAEIESPRCVIPLEVYLELPPELVSLTERAYLYLTRILYNTRVIILDRPSRTESARGTACRSVRSWHSCRVCSRMGVARGGVGGGVGVY